MEGRELLDTLWHELGHAVLHYKESNEVMLFDGCLLFEKLNNRMEDEANIFAAEGRITDDEIKDCISRGFTNEQTASYLDVDVNLVNLKIDIMSENGFNFNHFEYDRTFLA